MARIYWTYLRPGSRPTAAALPSPERPLAEPAEKADLGDQRAA
jgi:hypothetical protein